MQGRGLNGNRDLKPSGLAGIAFSALQQITRRERIMTFNYISPRLKEKDHGHTAPSPDSDAHPEISDP
jgi:hypothetical protein